MNFKNTSELFEYVRNISIPKDISLRKILRDYKFQKPDIAEVMELMRKSSRDEILLVDARSQKEYSETAIPLSVNFPVLTDEERHNVGLIYKKYSESAALCLAVEYAEPKKIALEEFLKAQFAEKKKIIVYCWRGGGRSSYLGKMINDIGFSASLISGGQKSYRKKVTEFFSTQSFPYRLLELSGLTGSGKTDLLRSISGDVPVIDLEKCARHYSSLLGRIPYDLMNATPVKNQSAFENNIYSEISFNGRFEKNPTTGSDDSIYIVEGESRKVGDFEIPAMLYKAMESSECVEIISSLENRVKRIVRDYFGKDDSGIPLMREKLLQKEKFFRQQVSSKVFDSLISLLEAGRTEEFTEVMIVKYYDIKYKTKPKKPLATISSDDTATARKMLIEIYRGLIK